MYVRVGEERSQLGGRVNDVAESVVVLSMVIFARIFFVRRTRTGAYECVCENRRVFVHDEVHVVDVYVYD
jgi:hypothetical protein